MLNPKDLVVGGVYSHRQNVGSKLALLLGFCDYLDIDAEYHSSYTGQDLDATLWKGYNYCLTFTPRYRQPIWYIDGYYLRDHTNSEILSRIIETASSGYIALQYGPRSTANFLHHQGEVPKDFISTLSQTVLNRMKNINWNIYPSNPVINNLYGISSSSRVCTLVNHGYPIDAAKSLGHLYKTLFMVHNTPLSPWKKIVGSDMLNIISPPPV